MKDIKLMHGSLKFPVFFPDGTYGVVKSVDSVDLKNSNVAGMIVNTFHLINKIGINNIKKVNGIHNLINFNSPIVSDSGGFQVFSMINENVKNGEIRPNGIIFRKEDGSKFLFTPEKCIQMQFGLNTDIIMCLDYCTHPNDPDEVNAKSVDMTIKWALKCKEEYDRQLRMRKYENGSRPLLFGIIQGGLDKELRKKCADSLIKIGFDGYGFGGWPLDSDNHLIFDILEYTASLMPDNTVKYAMGLGRPEEIVTLARVGYDLFDCVIPTREARHNRLYVFNDNPISEKPDFYDFVRIIDDKYACDLSKVSDKCDCELCTNYTKAYLHHLFKINDPQAYRLASIHNLVFFTKLMEKLQDER